MRCSAQLLILGPEPYLERFLRRLEKNYPNYLIEMNLLVGAGGFEPPTYTVSR